MRSPWAGFLKSSGHRRAYVQRLARELLPLAAELYHLDEKTRVPRPQNSLPRISLRTERPERWFRHSVAESQQE